MDVSVIIVNYNTSNLINDCLETVFEKTEGIEYEVIIVDNNTENLSEAIKYAEDSKVKLLQLPENIGFGRANNEGAKLATGRNLFFLNPDTLLINNAIKILSDFLDTHPKCGACGGNLYDIDLKPIHSFQHLLPGIKEIINLFLWRLPVKFTYGSSDFFNYNEIPLKVGYITGADLMIRRALFTKIKGFDISFFMYFEETNLCYKLKKLGKSIYSVPEAMIIHLEGQTFVSHEKLLKREQYYAEGLVTYLNFFNKFHRWIALSLYITYYNLVLILRRNNSSLNLIYKERLRLLKSLK